MDIYTYIFCHIFACVFPSESNLKKMERKEDTVIAKACSLNNEPVSGRDIEEIVAIFNGVENKRLAAKILNPQYTDDFNLKFLKDHEEFVSIQSKRVRTCHNLNARLADKPYDDSELYLFIHGLGGSIEQFLPLLKLSDLCKKRFVAVDLWGFGQSDELENYDMERIAISLQNITEILFDRHNFKFSDINLIGHSMGCYVSLHLFDLFSTKLQYNISNLVLLAPPKSNVIQLSKDNHLTQFILNSLFKFPGVFTFYREWFDQRKGLSSSGIQSFFYQGNRNTGDEMSLNYLKLVQFYNNIQIKSRTIIGYLLGWKPIDWQSIFEKVTKKNTKILIICGEDDKVTDIESFQSIQESLNNYHNANLITIPQCAHNLCFDASKQVCTIFKENILTQQ